MGLLVYCLGRVSGNRLGVLGSGTFTSFAYEEKRGH
jgi:hypothetical protein